MPLDRHFEIQDSEEDGALTESDVSLPSPAKPDPAPPSHGLSPFPDSGELRRQKIAADTAAVLSMTSTISTAPTRMLPSSNSKAKGDIYDFDVSSESDSIQVVARPPLKKDKKRSTTTPGATRGKRRDDDDDAEDSDFPAATTASTKKKPAKKKRAKTLPTTITSLISDSEDELAAKDTRTPRRSRKEVDYTIPPLIENDEEVAAKSRKTAGRSRNAVNYYIPPPPDTDEEVTPPAYRTDPPRSVKKTHIMVDMTHPDLMLATQQRREYIPAVNTSQMTNLESVQSTVPDGDMGNVEIPPLPSQLRDQNFVEPGYSAEAAEAAREPSYNGSKRRSVTESALGSGLGSGFDAGSVASEWRAAKGKPNYAEVQPFEEEDDEWGAQSDGGARGKGKKGKKEAKTTAKKRTPAKPSKKKEKIHEVEESIVIPAGKEHEKLAELRRLENLSPASLGPHSQAQLHALRDTFKPTPPTQNTTIHVNTQQPPPAPPMDSPATNDGFKEPEKPSLYVKLKVGQRAMTYSGTDSDTSPQRKFKRTKSRFPDGVGAMLQSPSKPTPSRKKSRPVIEDEDDVIAVAEPAAKKLKATAEDEEKQSDDHVVPAAEPPARKKSKSAAKDEEEYGVEKPKPVKKTPARKKSKAAAASEEVSIQVKPARKKSKAAAADEEKEKPVDAEPAPEPAPAPRHKSRAVISDSEEDGSLSSVPPSPDKPTTPPPPPKSPTPPPVQEKPAPKRKRTKSAKEPAPTKSKKQKAKEPEPEPQPQKSPTPEAPKEKETTEKDTSKEKETPNTPTKKKIAQHPAHSPIRREGKVPLRVGLSRRHRIEPLLKIVRKKA